MALPCADANDYSTGKLSVVRELPFSEVESQRLCMALTMCAKASPSCGWNGLTCPSPAAHQPHRFQHPTGHLKKECVERGKKYFSVASGGGTGRTLHPDNMAAGPASYGLTDTMGRMHSDAQFAGSSSVPAHVEMMGLIGMGNNPMVGATVAVAVAIEEASK